MFTAAVSQRAAVRIPMTNIIAIVIVVARIPSIIVPATAILRSRDTRGIFSRQNLTSRWAVCV